MPFISKSKLKANMLRIFREIEETGEEWIVTDHNRPVLRIQPIAQKKLWKRYSERFRAKSSIEQTSIRRLLTNGECCRDCPRHFSPRILNTVYRLFGDSTSF